MPDEHLAGGEADKTVHVEQGAKLLPALCRVGLLSGLGQRLEVGLLGRVVARVLVELVGHVVVGAFVKIAFRLLEIEGEEVLVRRLGNHVKPGVAAVQLDPGEDGPGGGYAGIAKNLPAEGLAQVAGIMR